MQLKNQTKIIRKCAITGIILIIANIIIIPSTYPVYNWVLDSLAVLDEDKSSFFYSLWKDTPFSIRMDVYLFNWTNPEDLMNKNIKPRLEQLGPYVFIEDKNKTDIVKNENGTISFKHRKRWDFDPVTSNGSLTDLFTSLNPIILTAVKHSEEMNFLLKQSLSLSLQSFVNELPLTSTAGEILFEGVEDSLFTLGKSLPKVSSYDYPDMDNFAWFAGRNLSEKFEGTFNMGTGLNGTKLGQLYRWNNVNYSHYYEGECNKISGSAGEFFSKYLQKTDIDLFFIDLCRPLNFQFEEEINFKGIKAYKFVGGEKTFDNGTKYPEYKCYCTKPCQPSGVQGVAQCKFGSPGFISFPHFYNADPYFAKQFEGLSPNKEKHQADVSIEPRTGFPVNVHARFQLNMLLEPNNNFKLLRDVPKLYFPVLWFTEHVDVPDHLLWIFKLGLIAPSICYSLAITGLIIGFLLLTPAIILYNQNKQLKQSQFNSSFDNVEYTKAKDHDTSVGF